MVSSAPRAVPLMPDGLASALSRRLAELGGLALILLSAAAIAALASWSALDPSFNLATYGPARNLLGRPGAVFADFLMQLVGLAAVVLVLPLAVWGWRLLTHRPPVRIKIRLFAWFASVVFAAGFAACVKPTFNWPLSTGLGGIAGDLLLGLPTLFFGGVLPFPNRLGIGVGFGLLAAASLAVAFGFGFSAKLDDEPEAEDAIDIPGKAIVSLGALTHGFLAFKARLFGGQRGGLRALLREMFGRDLDPAPPLARREPMLDADDADFDRMAPEARRRVLRAPVPKRRRAPRGRYELPPLDLLAATPKERAPALSAAALEENAEMLEDVLEDFGVRGEIVHASPGPVITLYELEPAPGVKSSRVIGLADDIA
ncbi:MAG TPA: DNA translocase FtsK 4TM domain-containing protein, partial [Xanthobacteraceae bacterium]|nr:DNA translocase FtsK 4TM domain-containing protein [Xanthobacteraceae bacterium]